MVLGMASGSSSPESASSTRSVLDSEPPWDTPQATYRPSGEGTNQSRWLCSRPASAAGSRSTRVVGPSAAISTGTAAPTASRWKNTRSPAMRNAESSVVAAVSSSIRARNAARPGNSASHEAAKLPWPDSQLASSPSSASIHRYGSSSATPNRSSLTTSTRATGGADESRIDHDLAETSTGRQELCAQVGVSVAVPRWAEGTRAIFMNRRRDLFMHKICGRPGAATRGRSGPTAGNPEVNTRLGSWSGLLADMYGHT